MCDPVGSLGAVWFEASRRYLQQPEPRKLMYSNYHLHAGPICNMISAVSAVSSEVVSNVYLSEELSASVLISHQLL